MLRDPMCLTGRAGVMPWATDMRDDDYGHLWLYVGNPIDAPRGIPCGSTRDIGDDKGPCVIACNARGGEW